jgi:hypothetical protein
MFFIPFVCPPQLLHGTLRSWLIFHKHAVLGLICFCRQSSHNLRQVLKLLALVMLRTSQVQYLSNLDQCSTSCTLELASNLALGYKVSSSHELSAACMSFKVIDLFLYIYILQIQRLRRVDTRHSSAHHATPDRIRWTCSWKRANNITGTTSCKCIELQTDLVSLKRRSEIYEWICKASRDIPSTKRPWYSLPVQILKSTVPTPSRIWSATPPAAAAAHNYLSQLMRLLAAQNAPNSCTKLLVAASPAAAASSVL